MESDIISKFDVLILDECQDTSYLVQNLFNNAKCNQKLALGDNNQSIMEWNGSINAIKNINGTQYKLSQSHRIGQDSATICNHLYNDYSDEDSFYISGANYSQKVYPRSHLLPQDFDKCAVLRRTNATVLANAIECAKNGKWLYFLGGIDGYKLDFYVSLYYFSRGTKQKGGVFSKFKDYQDMLEYVEETEDVELLSAIGILKRYNSNLPNFVNLIKEMSIKDKSKANVILSTVHKSKGDTLTVPVLLQDDLIETFHLDAQLLALDFENASDFQVEQFYNSSREELNLLYVAITRAKCDLYLNKDLTNYCKRKGIL